MKLYEKVLPILLCSIFAPVSGKCWNIFLRKPAAVNKVAIMIYVIDNYKTGA